MERYSVEPLVAVGWEGFFGTLSLLIFFPILATPAVSRLSPFFECLLRTLSPDKLGSLLDSCE